MPARRSVQIPLDGLDLLDCGTGQLQQLGDLPGVSVVVLIRHRH
jgi:hypothetical protein